MLLTIVLTILVTVLVFFFSLVVGMKLADLFDTQWVTVLGCVVGLAVGIGFGLTRMPFPAGLLAGLVGSCGAAYAFWRNRC